MEAGNDAEVLDEHGESDDGQSNDCDCVKFHADAELPCFTYYQAGLNESVDS